MPSAEDTEPIVVQCELPRPTPQAPFNVARLALYIVLGWLIGGSIVMIASDYLGFLE